MNIFHTILLNQHKGTPTPPPDPEPPDDSPQLVWSEDAVSYTGYESHAGTLASGHNLYSPRAWWHDGKTYILFHGNYVDDGFGQGYLLVYDENNGIIGMFRVTSTEPIADSHTTPSMIVDNNGVVFVFQERTHGSPIDIYKGHFNDFALLSEKIGGSGATLGYMNILKDENGNGISWCRFGTGSIRHQCVVEATNGFENWLDERRLSTSPGSPLAHYVMVPYYAQLVGDWWYVTNCEREDDLVTFQGWWQKYYVYRTPKEGPERFVVFYNLLGDEFSHDTTGDNYLTKGIMDTNFRYYNAGGTTTNGWIPISTVGPNGEFYSVTGDGEGGMVFHSIIDRVLTTIPLNISNYTSDLTSQASAAKSLAYLHNRLELVMDIEVGGISKSYFFTSLNGGTTWSAGVDMVPEDSVGTSAFVMPMNYLEIPDNRNFLMVFFENDAVTANTRKMWVKRAAKGALQSESPTMVTVPDSYYDAFNVFHYVAADGQITRSGNNVTGLTDQFGLRNATGTNNPQWNGSDAITMNGTSNYFTIPVSGQNREKFTLFAIARGSGSSQSNLLTFADNTSASRFLAFAVYDTIADSACVTFRDDAGRNLKEIGQDVTNDDQWHALAFVLDARCKVDIYIDGKKQFYENDGYTAGITDFAKRGKSNFGGTFNSIRIGSRDTNGTDLFYPVSFKEMILKNTVYDYETFRGLYKKIADAHGITLNWGFQ